MNILDWMNKGGPVMVPLLICSFIALTFIIERSLFWLVETTKRRQKTLEEILSLTKKGKRDEALCLAKKCADPIAKVLESGLESSKSSISQAMQVAASQVNARRERFLSVMDTLITLSPLLGILGTVIGIIHSFEVLGVSAVVDPKGVTKGVAEALLTTAFGLTIAIFTLIPYNHFSRKLESSQSVMEHYAYRLEMILLRDSHDAI